MGNRRPKKPSRACRSPMICSECERARFKGKCFSLGLIIREEPELIDELDAEEDLLCELIAESASVGVRTTK